jgi:tripartite-type tricarboxylate transporter receptor subunit TctC
LQGAASRATFRRDGEENMRRRRAVLLGGLASVAAGARRDARAQPAPAWSPSRPLRLIVPWPPAGTTDIVARMLAQPLGEALGQTVVVENRAGASGLIGTEAIVRADADGHAFGFIISTHVANAHLVRQHPYDPVRDVTPLVWVANVGNILVVPHASPIRTVQEFVEQGRRSPRPLTFGSPGTGSSVHFSGEMFRLGTGVPMQHVPYRGGGPALTDVIAGNIDLMFGNATSTLPHVRSGRLRALAVTTGRRAPYLPDVPTVAEVVLPGFEIAEWYGLIGPRGMPPAAAQRLNLEVNRIITQPAMRARLFEQGAEVVGGKAEEVAALIARDLAKYGDVIRAAGITAD